MVDSVVLAGVLAVAFVDVAARVSTSQKYMWSGEVVAYDQKGKTLTVKAPYRKHIDRYIGEFTRGDKVMLTWGTPGPGETDAIIYVGRYEAKSLSNFGDVLPVEFVSADTTKHEMTFTVAIPSSAFKILRTVQPGGWITATTPFDQPGETAVITAIERSTEPRNPARQAGS
jgi:hypothetical protein